MTIDWALVAERTRADAVAPPDAPGCYLGFVADPALADVLGPYAMGFGVLYCGSAISLRGRMGRHAKTIREASRLSFETVWWTLLQTESVAGAAVVEAVLIDELRPPWNDRLCAGFGNQHPGYGRLATARVSPWDVTFRGRSWAGPVDPLRTMQSRLRLNQVLLDCDRHRWLWDSLCD